MRSHYKKLGPYIREVVKKNNDLSVQKLLGVSVTKAFIPSIANTVGTDMSKYKIVRQNQFAYGPVTSRNSDKISVALLSENECIVSTSYTVFKIIDHKALLPEYLMMWFRRPEFDRYARYMSHGSVRELFGWEEMCDVELPIPSPLKQREIVKEYNSIVDRIKLNEQLNQKLEEAAQAIFKEWFVDFEFPALAEDTTSIGDPEFWGEPYNSSGGEMVYSEELRQEIPKGWLVCPLEKATELIIDHRGKTPTKLNGEWSISGYPAISAKNIKGMRIVQPHTIRYVDEDLYQRWMKDVLIEDDVIMTSEAPLGELYYVAKKSDYLLSQRLFGLRANKKKLRGSYLIFWLQTGYVKSEFDGRASGTTVSGIRQAELKKINVLVPDTNLMERYHCLVKPMLDLVETREHEVLRSHELRQIILSRMSLS